VYDAGQIEAQSLKEKGGGMPCKEHHTINESGRWRSKGKMKGK
jgi:hypothetical protein